MRWTRTKRPKEPLYSTVFVPPPATEIPDPPPIPRRYTSSVDRDALILAELRAIKEILKIIKDRL